MTMIGDGEIAFCLFVYVFVCLFCFLVTIVTRAGQFFFMRER